MSITATAGDHVIRGRVSPSKEAETRPVAHIIRLAFYAYFASIPFEVKDRVIPMEIPTLMACVFLLTTLLQPGICYRRFPRGFWCLTAFFSVYVISSLLNGFPYPVELTKDFFRVLQLLVLLWAGYNLMRDSGVATSAVVTLAVASLVRELLQVVGIGVEATVTGRVTVLNQDQNYSAKIMAVGLLIFIGVTYGRSQSLFRPRFLIWPCVAVIGVAIVQTGSRGALVALVAGLFCFIFAGDNVGHRLRNVCMAMVAFSCLVWISYRSDMMRDRWVRAVQKGDMAKREKIFPIFWGMFCEKPIAGWGPLSNNKEAGRRMRLPGYRAIGSHNLILDVMTATGVLGAIPLGAAIWMYVCCAWKARHGPQGVLALAVIVSVLVGNLSVDRLRSKLLWFSFMYAVSCGSHVTVRRQRLTKEKRLQVPAFREHPGCDVTSLREPIGCN